MDSREFVVPVPSLCAVTGDQAGIVIRTVFKICLGCLLHLDDEFIALVGGAADIEPRRPCFVRVIDVFGVSVDDVVNFQTVFEYALQQADQEFFARLRPE